MIENVIILTYKTLKTKGIKCSASCQLHKKSIVDFMRKLRKQQKKHDICYGRFHDERKKKRKKHFYLACLPLQIVFKAFSFLLLKMALSCKL